jgi:hypothetical protein
VPHRSRVEPRLSSTHGAEWNQRNLRQTSPLRDLPSQVRVTRPHHALEGKVLEVFAKLRHKGRPHFMLVLPDGSRSYIPVAWTDFVAPPAGSAAPCSIVASASDLLRLRQRVDCLLRRIQAGPSTEQNSSTQESQHATAATGAVECRTSSHSTDLSTTHPRATEQSGQPPGRTSPQNGPKTPDTASSFHSTKNT